MADEVPIVCTLQPGEEKRDAVQQYRTLFADALVSAERTVTGVRWTLRAADGVEARALAEVFAALADPVRLRLLSLIAAAGECCSCDLEGPLGKSQPTVSHHTKALMEAGLITGDKRGRWTWWRVVPERLAAVRAALEPKG